MHAGEWYSVLATHHSGYPFTHGLPLGDFGYLAIGENARKILKGMYKPLPETDPYSVKLFSFLKMHENMKLAPLVSTVLSTEDFQVGWRRAQEIPYPGH